MSLKIKTLRGLFWTFSEQLSVKLVMFVVQIILARILAPTDFGLIAMIMVFMSIGSSLTDSGMTSSLIRTVDADQRDYSTVFFMNVATSALLYLVVFAAAPYIAAFYNQGILINIIRVFSISFIIRAFVGVQTTILSKQLKFREQMMMQIPSVIASGIVALVLASTGYGAWSLVWMYLSQSLIFAVQHWWKSEWYPEFLFDQTRLRKHFGFGFKLTLAGLLSAVFANIYNLVIGKWFSPLQLGYYNRADTIQMFPTKLIITAFKNVAYPVLSTIQHDDDRLKRSYKRMMLQVVFWVTPLLILLVVVAEPLFRLLLTEKWLPAVPYFKILCIASLLYPLQEYNLQILDVKGRSDLYLKIEMVKKGLMLITIALVLPYGITGLLIGQILLSFIFYGITSFYSGRLIKFSTFEQIKSVYCMFIIAIVCGVCTQLLDTYLAGLSMLDVSRLGISSFTYFIMYFSLSLIFKISALQDVVEIKRHFLNK